MSDVPTDVLMRKLVYGLSEEDGSVDELEAIESAVERVEGLAEENERLRGRVAELEAQVDNISDIGAEKSTKEEKIAALVTWAQRQASDQTADRVVIKARDIVGCTGVSRRYAYDLIDDLPTKYEWLLDRSDVSQYGDLELDRDSQDRAVVVDLELLHEDEGSVNKFTTATSRNGGEA